MCSNVFFLLQRQHKEYELNTTRSQSHTVTVGIREEDDGKNGDVGYCSTYIVSLFFGDDY